MKHLPLHLKKIRDESASKPPYTIKGFIDISKPFKDGFDLAYQQVNPRITDMENKIFRSRTLLHQLISSNSINNDQMLEETKAVFNLLTEFLVE
jgi:hypothetical protein